MRYFYEEKGEKLWREYGFKDAITNAKIRRTVEAAHEYVLLHGLDIDVRFDVISVIPSPSGYKIEHIEDAFLAPIN